MHGAVHNCVYQLVAMATCALFIRLCAITHTKDIDASLKLFRTVLFTLQLYTAYTY